MQSNEDMQNIRHVNDMDGVGGNTCSPQLHCNILVGLHKHISSVSNACSHGFGCCLSSVICMQKCPCRTSCQWQHDFCVLIYVTIITAVKSPCQGPWQPLTPRCPMQMCTYACRSVFEHGSSGSVPLGPDAIGCEPKPAVSTHDQ